MTISRNVDWSPVGYHDDPIHGDPDALERWRNDLQRTIASLDQAKRGIERLTGDQKKMESLSLTKALAQANEVCGDLNKVRDRYVGAADAMGGYIPVLRDEQRISLQARDEAEAALSARNKAEAAKSAAKKAAHNDNPTISQQGRDDAGVAATQYNNAQGALGAAKKKLHDAIMRRNEAASAAQNKIREANRHSKLNDNFMDRFLANPVFKWVWDHLGDIASVLDFAAWVCTFIPCAQGFAAVLKVLATVFKVLDAIKNMLTVFMKMQDIHNGKGGWGELVVALGGVVMSGGGVKELGGLKAAKDIGKSGGRINQLGQKVSAFGEKAKKLGEKMDLSRHLRNSIANAKRLPFPNLRKAGKDGGKFGDFFTDKVGDRCANNKGLAGRARDALMRGRSAAPEGPAADYLASAKAKGVAAYKLISRDCVRKTPAMVASSYSIATSLIPGFQSPKVAGIDIVTTPIKAIGNPLGTAKTVIDRTVKTYWK